MSLLEELIADSGRRGSECTVGKWLDSLPDGERADWDAAFANHNITASAILRALQRREIAIGLQPVSRHTRRIRRGDGCTCPR